MPMCMILFYMATLSRPILIAHMSSKLIFEEIKFSNGLIHNSSPLFNCLGSSKINFYYNFATTFLSDKLITTQKVLFDSL